MKKGIIFILLIVFLVFASTRVVSASFSLGKFFGGRVIETTAIPIEALKDAGYTCPMFGTSISILPLGSQTSTPINYFIPSYITSKTRTTPKMGGLILGKYEGQSMITCTRPCPPSVCVETVSLDTINLFGTSR